MKNTFAKWGAAALALALVFAFASCAQPTEETSSGPATPTIIRLHLDKQETTNFANTTFEIRVAEELYVPPALATNYPYPLVAGLNDGKTSNDPILETDRGSVIAIPALQPRSDAIAESVLQRLGKKKFLASGILQAVAGVEQAGDQVQGVPIQTDNDQKKQRYIDIELVDLSPSSAAWGSVYSKSINGYVELAVTGTTATSGVDPTTAYLYTGKNKKRAFNDLHQVVAGVPVPRTNNANIQRISLKPGINELYLAFFSNTQYVQ